VHVLCASVDVLVLYVERARKVLPVVMYGAQLQAAAAHHGGIDAHRVVGAGELVPLGALQKLVRQAQLLHELLQYLKVLLHLTLGVGLVHMAGVGLEEVDLPDADEGAGLLGLVPEGVDQLVDLKGQVPVRANPYGEHGVHRGLRSRPQEQGDVQLIEACVRNPVHLGVEALDVLLLLLELGLGDQEREADLVMVGGVQLLADEGVDVLHDLPPVGGPDVHSLDRIALVGKASGLDELIVPLAEVLFLLHPSHP